MADCCEHDQGAHLMGGLRDVELGVPIGGERWCPSCECKATWSLQQDQLDELRRAKGTDSRVWGKGCQHCPGVYRVDSVGSMFDYVYVTCVRCRKEAIV